MRGTIEHVFPWVCLTSSNYLVDLALWFFNLICVFLLGSYSYALQRVADHGRPDFMWLLDICLRYTKSSHKDGAVTHIHPFTVLIISMLRSRNTSEVWVRQNHTEENKDRAAGENLQRVPFGLHAQLDSGIAVTQPGALLSQYHTDCPRVLGAPLRTSGQGWRRNDVCAEWGHMIKIFIVFYKNVLMVVKYFYGEKRNTFL